MLEMCSLGTERLKPGATGWNRFSSPCVLPDGRIVLPPDVKHPVPPRYVVVEHADGSLPAGAVGEQMTLPGMSEVTA